VPFNVGGEAPKRKRACKYGPRDADGYCPKKKKGGGSKRPCKYGRGSDGYCNKKPSTTSWYDKNPPATKSDTSSSRPSSSAEKAAEKVTEKAVDKVISNGKTAAATGAIIKLLKTPVSQVGARALGATAIAGIAAFAVTHYILTKVAKTKAAKQQAAYEAGEAYKQARKLAQEANKGPLTAQQQAQLAAAFRAQLAKLGLSTTNLGRKLS
jgi:hypothetical protein